MPSCQPRALQGSVRSTPSLPSSLSCFDQTVRQLIRVADVWWEVPGEQFPRLLHRRDQTVTRPTVLPRIHQDRGDPYTPPRIPTGTTSEVGDDSHLWPHQRTYYKNNDSPPANRQ